jgi:hypothetical protein
MVAEGIVFEAPESINKALAMIEPMEDCRTDRSIGYTS